MEDSRLPAMVLCSLRTGINHVVWRANSTTISQDVKDGFERVKAGLSLGDSGYTTTNAYRSRL